jgi:hypothetical protein
VGKVYLPDPRSFPNHASDQNGGHHCRHVAIENKQNGGREPGEFNDVAEKENQNGGQQTGKDLENHDMEQDVAQSSDFPVACTQSSGKKIKARLDIEEKEEDEDKFKKNGQDIMEARLRENVERKKQDKENREEETEEEKVEEENVEEEKVEEEKVEEEKVEEEKVEEKKVEEEKVEEEKVEEKKVEDEKKSVDCGAPCKFCLFLVSGHTKVILAFKDKTTLMVSPC